MSSNNRTLEIGTGLFVLLGFAALAFLTTQLPGSGIKIGGKDDGFHVTARFDNVGDLKVGARVHVRGSMAGKEDRHQNRKEEHVGSQRGKDKEANAQQQFARAATFVSPVIASAVAALAIAAGGPPDDRRNAAQARISQFLLRRFVGKSRGHGETL